MRNSERLAAIKRVIDPNGNRILIQNSTALGGVINRIEQWPEIHQALAVLAGYTEDGVEVPGLTRPNQSSDYIAELIREYPPNTTEFPAPLFNSIQERLDSFCQDLPIIVHTLERISTEPSDSSLTAQYQGRLSIDEFEQAVSNLVRVADLLKIKNEVNEVWTDFGSTVFGFEIDPGLALAMFHAAMSGADQIRTFIAAMTPEMVRNCLRLLSMLVQEKGGDPLPDDIVSDQDLGRAISQFAHGEVTIPIPEKAEKEQINGLKSAIPILSQMGEQGWKLTCSAPTIEGSSVTQSLVIINSQVNIQALPQPREDTDS